MTSPSSSASAPTFVDSLVVEHLPLARYAATAVANRLQLPAHVNREDLVACAHIALIESAHRYDPTTGASFATYAHRRLQGAVLDELRATDWATRTVRADGRRLNQATEALTAELGASPTRTQVADRLGVTTNELDALREKIARANVTSIDDRVRDDLRPAHAVNNDPAHALLEREQVTYLFDALDHLPDNLGEVVSRNFFEDQSLTQIAKDMGLTLSAISQMRAKALRLLHAALSEVVDGQPAEEVGGIRARAQQREYVHQVAQATRTVRSRLSEVRASA